MNAANFWTKDGVSASRADFYPKILYSFGNDFMITQTAAFRGTGYSFYHSGNTDDNTLRSAFEYNINGHTSLYRKYPFFTHVIEPSVGYHFISGSENNLPVFDSTEFFKKTSVIELSLLNRITAASRELFTLRLTQGIDMHNEDQPFLPLKAEAGINSPVPIKFDITYNTHTGNLETATSELAFSILKANIYIGQRYNRAADIMMYNAALEYRPIKSLQLTSSLLYDAKGKTVSDMILDMKYLGQCWGIRLEAVKKPGDFTMTVKFDLPGITTKYSKR